MEFLESFDYLLELAERGRFIPTLDSNGRVAFIVHDRKADDLNLFLSFHFSRSINIHDQLITLEDEQAFDHLFALVTRDKSVDAMVCCSRSRELGYDNPHCFRKWSELDSSDDEHVRYCRDCHKPVYRVVDTLDLFEHIAKNHCFAFFSESMEEEISEEVSFETDDPNLYVQAHPQSPDYVHITQEGWWTWSTSMTAHSISPKRWFTRSEIEVIKLLDTLYHTLDDGEDNELLCSVAARARRDLREVNSKSAPAYRDTLERLINRQIEVDQSQNRDRFAEKDPEFMEYLRNLEEEAERESRIQRDMETGDKKL